MKFLDLYDLRARAFPALLCLLPPMILLLSAYGVVIPWWQTGLSLLISCGFVFLLARIARDAGKRIQDKLFHEWTGPPTTQLLRHSNEHFDIHTKQHLHSQLATLTGLPFPSASDELVRPREADDVYRAATAWLLKHTRDTQRFPLLFKENIHFGFQRNALGLRWVGLAFAVTSIALLLSKVGVLSIYGPYYVVDRWQSFTAPNSASLLVSVLMAMVWLFAITNGADKRTAFAYAERLLEAADILAADVGAAK
jgi:hypothetical protein